VLGSSYSHAVDCKRGVDRSNPIVRHNDQRRGLATFARQTGYQTREEQRLPGSDDRPGDVIVSDYERGRSLCIDVAIFNPLREDVVRRGTANPYAGHEMTETRKRQKKQTEERVQAAGMTFAPFVVSVYGCHSRDAQSTIASLAHRITTRTREDAKIVAQRYYQRATLVLLRDNARQILARIPALPRASNRPHAARHYTTD